MSKVTTNKDFKNGLKVSIEVNDEVAEVVIPTISRGAKSEDGASILASGQMNPENWTADETANYINYVLTSIKALTETYGGSQFTPKQNIDAWLGVVADVISDKDGCVTGRLEGRKTASATSVNKKIVLEGYLKWLSENEEAIIASENEFAVQATIDKDGVATFVGVKVDSVAILTVMKAGLAGMSKPQLIALYKENSNLL